MIFGYRSSIKYFIAKYLPVVSKLPIWPIILNLPRKPSLFFLLILRKSSINPIEPIQMADIINNLINEVIREVGATAITITHDMESARKIANNISMLYKGKVIWTGKASEIDNSDNKYLDQFIKGKSVGPIKININD